MDLDLRTLTYRKSSFSSQDETCVEMAVVPGAGRAIRNSRNPGGGTALFTEAEWSAFIAGAKAGEFD